VHDVLVRDLEGLSVERGAAGEHFVEDDAEGEEVGAVVDDLVEDLLGGDVEGRAEDDAALGQAGGCLVAVAHGDGQPEVEDAGDRGAVLAPLHHDVAGLEVAVDQAATVGVGEALGQLAGEAQGAERVEGRFAVDEVGQDLPVDEVHDQVEEASLAAPEVDHGDQLGVAELTGEGGLLGEAGAHAGIGDQVAEEDLDREAAGEAEVAGAVDHPHRALADQLLEEVAAGQLHAEQRVAVARGQLGAVGWTALEGGAEHRQAHRAAHR
jgi:hypothetical protein